ncbi:hypothetical protein D3C81_1106060 [compost metagenome]
MFDFVHVQTRYQVLLKWFALEFDAAAEHPALCLPQRPQLIVEGGQQIERRAFGVGLQVLHLHADTRPIHPAHGA